MSRGFSAILLIPVVLVILSAVATFFIITNNKNQVDTRKLNEETSISVEESENKEATEAGKTADQNEKVILKMNNLNIKFPEHEIQNEASESTQPAVVAPTKSAEGAKPIPSSSVKPSEEPQVAQTPFCNKYGTAEVKKSDIPPTYLASNNSDINEITFYARARGNITFNKSQPMFGVNAPNMGTGPFIISQDIKGMMTDIKEGDCVEVFYGSIGFDPIKVMLGVRKQ